MVNAIYITNFILFLSFMLTASLSLIASVFFLFDKSVKKYIQICMRFSLLFFVLILVLCLFLLFLYLKVIPKPLEFRPFPSFVAQIINLCIPFIALQIILIPIIFRKSVSPLKWVHISVAIVSIIGFIILFSFIRTQLIPETMYDFIWWF